MIQRRTPMPGPMPRRGDGKPVLAVGGRVLVTARPGVPVVALSDENGVAIGISMGTDDEVEIVAWRPRGPSGPRYRIRSAADGVEGWVDAGSLRPRPAPPPVAPRPQRLAPAPPPRAGVSARPRRPVR